MAFRISLISNYWILDSCYYFRAEQIFKNGLKGEIDNLAIKLATFIIAEKK